MFTIDGFVDRGGVDSGSSTAVELPVMLLVTLLFRVLVGEYSLLMMFIIACSYAYVIISNRVKKKMKKSRTKVNFSTLLSHF